MSREKDKCKFPGCTKIRLWHGMGMYGPKHRFVEPSDSLYTVEAGRGICLNGKRIVTIEREEEFISPTNADELTRLIVELLNKSLYE